MAETHGFIRVPPDSTGKRLSQSVMMEFRVGTMTGVPVVDEACSFGTTGLIGTISEVESVAGGYYDLHIALLDPIPNGVTATVGETFYQNEIAIGVVATAGVLFYYQQNVIAGGYNHTNFLHIDEDGAASVTFPEGSPQLDAFGKMQVSTQHKLAEYIMRYDDLPTEFTNTIVGAASTQYLHDVSGVRMTTGTAAGDKVSRTSNEYHPYQAGVSQLIEFTAVIGDSGKPNVVRRMGLFDDDDGIFIEMYESTFNLVVRSSVSGSPVDLKIPSSLWNKDRLNGGGGAFNPSKFQVNPTLNNVYWIDFQWLGAGRIRFGLIVDGVRIVAHEVYNSNVRVGPYMSKSSLPFKMEQENIGVAQSSSEMTQYCAVVMTEGAYSPLKTPFSTSNAASVTTVSSTPIVSLRPAQTYKTYPNRNVIYPAMVSVYNDANEPMVVEMWLGSVATAGTWAAVGGLSSAEENKTATAITSGQARFSFIVGPKQTKEFNANTLKDGRRGLRRRADITLAPPEMSVQAKLIAPGTGGNVSVAVVWDEVSN